MSLYLSLAVMSADELEQLRSSASRLLDGIEQHLELHNACAAVISYQEDGRTFYAESVDAGVLINPCLPTGFSSMPHAERCDAQRARWLGRPFIQLTNWMMQEESARQMQAKLIEYDCDLAVPDLDAHICQRQVEWFSRWPAGCRFEVLCLDGEADEPSSWGEFHSLAEAFDCIHARRVGSL